MSPPVASRIALTVAAVLALASLGAVRGPQVSLQPRITYRHDVLAEQKAQRAAARDRRWPGPRSTRVDRSIAYSVFNDVLYRWQERPRSLRFLVGEKLSQPFPRWWTDYLPAPQRKDGAWRVRALIASYKSDAYRKLTMRLDGEPGTLDVDIKVGPEFRLTDLAVVHRIADYLDTPMVLPSVANATTFLPEESQLKSTTLDLHFLVDGQVLNVDIGDAEFDGCGGPDNATPITIAGKPALMEEDSPHAGSYVIWPASHDDPWAKFGLFGNYPMSTLVQWATEMIHANRARHAASAMGC